jgi:hypothetical protein
VRGAAVFRIGLAFSKVPIPGIEKRGAEFLSASYLEVSTGGDELDTLCKVLSIL